MITKLRAGAYFLTYLLTYLPMCIPTIPTVPISPAVRALRDL